MLVRTLIRRPRWLVAAAAAVAVVAVVAVTTGGAEPRPRPAGVPVVPPAERLVSDLAFVVRTPPDRTPPGDLPIPFFEVLPDGAVRSLGIDVPPHTTITTLQSMPDGRLLATGTRDLDPEVTHPDGPDNPGLSTSVMIFDGDGLPRVEHDVQGGGYTALLGATATEVVLLRFDPAGTHPARIVGVAMTTGAERLLGTTTGAVTAGDVTGDVAGDRVLVAGALGSEGDCVLETAGEQVAVPACQRVVEVNLAPESDNAAVVYERLGELRLRVVDTTTAVVYTDERLTPRPACSSCVVSAHGAGYLGTAWMDGTTLRVAQLDPLPLDLAPARVAADIETRLHTTAQTVPMP